MQSPVSSPPSHGKINMCNGGITKIIFKGCVKKKKNDENKDLINNIVGV